MVDYDPKRFSHFGPQGLEVREFLDLARDVITWRMNEKEIDAFVRASVTEKGPPAIARAWAATRLSSFIPEWNRAWEAALASVDIPEHKAWAVANVAVGIATEHLIDVLGYSKKDHDLLVEPRLILSEYAYENEPSLQVM